MKYVITLLVCVSINLLLNAQCERATAVNDYHNNYLANDFNVTELNWSGSQYSCNPGSYNQSVNNKILARINYFRRITGLNDDVIFDNNLNQICQQAAVMLEVNASLSHCNGTNNYPCNTWPCSTNDAMYASQHSVLASGHWSVFDPVSLYIEDHGTNNQPVGHRRWLLYLSMANADFSNAYVTMTDPNGFSVQLNIIYYNGYYGDPAIVWEPQNIQLNNTYDVTYTVTIGGIRNVQQSVYTYQTTIIKPTHPPVCPNNMQWSDTYCECRQPAVTNNCIDNIDLNNMNILTGLYSANEKINSSGTVHNKATVWFYAEDRITLNANFNVKAGASFKAKINACGY